MPLLTEVSQSEPYMRMRASDSLYIILTYLSQLKCA